MNLQSLKQRYDIIGNSEILNRALSTASRVASTDLTVLITGESGVGKEVFSRIIHQQSKRKHNKFIAINCGAIPAGTINSELFGHEKGAFTGATSERKGYFETVNGGTIFLDEIGEMPLDTQSFLLRILENGEFLKVGSSLVQKTDVRIVAATNVNLKEKIAKSKFREDLYYRLNTVPIHLPGLRDRSEDIHILFRKFALDFAEKYQTTPIRLDEKAILLIENYDWPGNIRELKNIVEQLSVLSEKKLISAADIADNYPFLLRRNLPAVHSDSVDQNLAEREILYKLLFDMKGDLNDLKSLVFNLIKTNNLSVPQIPKMDEMSKDDIPFFHTSQSNSEVLLNTPRRENHLIPEDKLSRAEIVDEILSLEEMERDLIKRALKKYKGRRKEAAKELGISERTLYRKIKEYDIN